MLTSADCATLESFRCDDCAQVHPFIPCATEQDNGLFTSAQRETLRTLREQETAGLIILGIGRMIGDVVFFADTSCVGAVLPNGQAL